MSKSIARPDKLPYAALQNISRLRNISICLQPENFLCLVYGTSTAPHDDHSFNIRVNPVIAVFQIL